MNVASWSRLTAWWTSFTKIPPRWKPQPQELGLEVQQAGPFGRQGGDSGMAARMDVVNTAFSDLVLGQGVVSDPIDLGENHIVLIHLKEHFPVVQLPLEDVRDQVVESVRNQRAMETASARAEELLASLAGGETMESLAESSGLELVQSEAATRNEPDHRSTLAQRDFPDAGAG